MESIPQAKPEMDQEMIDAAVSALQNERLVMGESVFKFEEAFAKYIGVKRAVSVSSGTDALILALLAVDCQGKEVVTTPFSFIATANSIVHAHGKPRFCDIKAYDRNLDVDKLPACLNENTKAIMPVHLFGHPCDMGAINDLAEERDLAVVEDACQAHGASYRGKKAGALGTIGCFSFYPTKNMCVGGDGGMITTDDNDLANAVAKLRDCGRTSRYAHDVVGFTSRLNTVNAAIGLVQLRRLDKWNTRRVEIANKYGAKLAGLKAVQMPPMRSADLEPVFHQYAIGLDDRDGLAIHLQSAGISSAVHYPIPIHLQPAYGERTGYFTGNFPVSEWLSGRLLSLPMFPSMKDDDVDLICEAINEHLG